MAAAAPPPTVLLRIPAKAEYVGLARLALSAVSRLTPLEADAVADLKLAVTEAASGFVGDSEGPTSASLSFSFALGEERLVLEVGAEPGGSAALSAEEQELGRAIMEATVDELRYDDGSIRLTKYLGTGPATQG